MLLQNQAHDSICGCSTDDVHSENITRSKKILQIANNIIDELKFENNFEEKSILNLSNKFFSGIVDFESTQEQYGFDKISSRKGFDKKLLTDTNRIPITEDYTTINTYLAEANNIESDQIEFLMPEIKDTDLEVSENCIKNNNICLTVEEDGIYINDVPFSLVDFVDLGDSYNNGPKHDDKGQELKLLKSKITLNTKKRVTLKIDFESARDIVHLVVSLDKNANYLKFNFDWNNTQKNHILEVCFELNYSCSS